MATWVRGKTDKQKKNLPYVYMENNMNPEPVLVQVKVSKQWKSPPSCIFPFPLPQLLPPFNSITVRCFFVFKALTWPKLSEGQGWVGMWVMVCRQRGLTAFTYSSWLPRLWSPSANSGVPDLRRCITISEKWSQGNSWNTLGFLKVTGEICILRDNFRTFPSAL